jgi:GT2 family glycosyltransferase
MACADDRVGAVAIGRDEGQRLRRCLTALRAQLDRVVYVDSGSRDGSPQAAAALGALVVHLDPALPFTAARARNAGAERLAELWPDVEYVQFVDGDCELVDGWLERGARALDRDPALAVVCGRRRERHPDASPYNLLCDIEWSTLPGPARACGGDSLMRLCAFRAVGGFDPAVIAGEEPELCLRLRRAGFRVERLDAEMTLHDAAMTRFGQWWRRCVRNGYAYSLGASMHGAGPERHQVRETRRIWFWGVLWPLATVGAALGVSGYAFGAVIAYAIPWRGGVRFARARGFGWRAAMLYGVACVVGKLPELQGMLRFRRFRLRGRDSAIIEYKRGGGTAAGVVG